MNERFFKFRYRFKQSAKLRALRAKNVLACQHALRAYVLTCQRALCANVLVCKRAILNNVNLYIIQIVSYIYA